MFVLMQSGIIAGIAAFKHKDKLVINMLRNCMPWANLNFLHKYLLIYLHYLNPCLRGLDLLVKISEHTHTHTHTHTHKMCARSKWQPVFDKSNFGSF